MRDRDEGFRELYAAHVDAVTGYALRRVDRAEDAADVVSETFLVAWRRQSDVPPGEGTRLWLYGVARRTLANQRRGDLRRTALGERLRHSLVASVPDHAFAVTEQETLRAAISRLADRDREILELAAWEELEPREIAEVLGISAVAVRTRLSRSRGRLRHVLGNDPRPAGHLTSTYSRLVPEEAP